MLALLLALQLADATPLREVDEVKSGTIVTTNDVTLQVVGGAYLPDSSFVATAKELAQLRAENATLKASPPDTQPASIIVSVAAFIVGAGLTAGLFVAIKH